MKFTKVDIVYSKIGMALVSAQRVEFLTGQLLKVLEDYEIYDGIMTDDFLANSEKSKKIRKKTLGHVFKLLKLNPKLVLVDELDEYARIRNKLVHEFWQNYLLLKSDKQIQLAMEFCYSFGRFSNRIEKFFQGFLYFIVLNNIKEKNDLNSNIKKWGGSFDYFMQSLEHKKLLEINEEKVDT